MSSFVMVDKQALNEFNEGNFLQAKLLFSQAVLKDNKNAENFFYLGQIYFKTGEIVLAMQCLNRFLNLNNPQESGAPNIPFAYDLLGDCYSKHGKDNEALECFLQAIKINPNHASAYHNIGLLYQRAAHYYLERNLRASFIHFQDAKRWLDKALSLDVHNAFFLHSIAEWHSLYLDLYENTLVKKFEPNDNILFHFRSAHDYFHQALSHFHQDPIMSAITKSNFSQCLAQFGHHFYKNENFADALICYSEALELDAALIPAINNKGMIFSKQKKYQAARECFLSILNYTSESQDIADVWLNVAVTYRLEKNWQEAQKSLIKAKELAPEDPDISKQEAALRFAVSQAKLTVSLGAIFNKRLARHKIKNTSSVSNNLGITS